MQKIFAALISIPFGSVFVAASDADGDSASKGGKGKKGGKGGKDCADTSDAVPYIQAFSPQIKAHTLDTRAAFVNADTTQGDWQFQGKVFRAWETQQASMVALNRFLTQVNQDYIFTTEASVSGYDANGIVAYVYQSQICDSVPLLGAYNQGAGDHYYTTNAREHSDLISAGWTDTGTSGYVLPLN